MEKYDLLSSGKRQQMAALKRQTKLNFEGKNERKSNGVKIIIIKLQTH